MLCEELSVQHIRGLSTANEGTKWVPHEHDRGCDVEASLTRMNSGPRNQHVITDYISAQRVVLSRGSSFIHRDVLPATAVQCTCTVQLCIQILQTTEHWTLHATHVACVCCVSHAGSATLFSMKFRMQWTSALWSGNWKQIVWSCVYCTVTVLSLLATSL